MSTKIDGKQIAAEIKTNLAERVNKLKAQGIQPGLGTLLVGEDPRVMKYVAGKHADCQEVGITSVRRNCRGRQLRRHRRCRTRTQRRSGLHRVHRPAAVAQGHQRERDHRHDRPGQGCRRHAPVQPWRTGAACARRHFDAAALHSARCARATRRLWTLI